MYNKFLEKYLNYDPKKVISKKGAVVRREKIPKKPVIFAATHGFREDGKSLMGFWKKILIFVNMLRKRGYRYFVTRWLRCNMNGVVYVDRKVKRE